VSERKTNLTSSSGRSSDPSQPRAHLLDLPLGCHRIVDRGRAGAERPRGTASEWNRRCEPPGVKTFLDQEDGALMVVIRRFSRREKSSVTLYTNPGAKVADACFMSQSVGRSAFAAAEKVCLPRVSDSRRNRRPRRHYARDLISIVQCHMFYEFLDRHSKRIQ
jgi:hypothetical protein